MKMPIAWHEECLKNYRSYLTNKKIELLRIKEQLKNDIVRMESEEMFYSAQINNAKNKKMDGFDVDRFMVKRKAKQ